MYKIKISIIVCWLLFHFVSIPIGLYGQQNETLANQNEIYVQGVRAFKEGNLSNAQLYLDQYLNETELDFRQDHLLQVQAEIYLVKAAYESDLENSDELLEQLEGKVPDHFLLHDAYLAKGDYYFRKKNYTEAIKTYEPIRLSLLNREAGHNVKFKLAYSYFVKKRFNEAAVIFDELSYVKNDFYYPANYYLGICQFLRSDFDDAIRSFKVVEKKSEYSPHIPYYLVQLYFTQEDYSTTIEYGEKQLVKQNLKNRYRIHHLLASAYFIQEDYKAAEPHYEKYEANTEKLSETDFYQLGYINYRLGQWEEAINYFLEISDVEGSMGQNTNYYLADCYLKTEQKRSARNALKKVTDYSIMNHLHEESLLNFGKLSAEMGYDREAIDALFAIPSNSLFYNEAQDLLSELFVQTNDYAKAQQMLEARDEVSHQLFEAYQKVSYFKALQAIRNEDIATAIEDLKKAIKTDRDLSVTAQSYYWLAEIAQRQGNFQESSHRLIKYFLLIKGVEEVAGQAAPSFAHYMQGYNYIKLDEYQAAFDEFSACLEGVRDEKEVDDKIKWQVYINSKLRAADCALKTRQYDVALEHYQFIIDSKNRFTPYALFQKAIIQHLNRNIYGAISILQKVVQDYPASDMVGLSLMHLGDMYMEMDEASKAYDAYLGLVNSELNGNEMVNKAYLKLGLLAYNLGDMTKSTGFYKSVLENNPSGNERKEALDALEEIYINDLNKAGEYVDLAVSLGGVKLENLYRDSLIYTAAQMSYEKDSLPMALEQFSAYLDSFPRGYFAVEAHFYRGQTNLTLKNYNEAYDDFAYVVDLGPGEFYVESCFNAALISFNYTKKFSKAFRHYSALEDVLDNEVKKYDAQLGALRSAFRINDLYGVRQYSAKVINSTQASPREVASAHYFLGKVAYKNAKYDEAIQAFNRVINGYKNSTLAAESRYMIALIYYEREEYGIAEELCQNANSQNSAYPYWVAKSLILLSDILVKKGDLFNARAALEATIENYQEDASIVNEAKAKLDEVIDQQNAASRLEQESKDGTIKMDSIDD
jgi:tetratricopeptide (TPR) repeat protein